MKLRVLRQLSGNVEKLMTHAGLTPKELAHKSKIGYSSLTPILNGNRDFGVTKLIALANALQCSPNTLLNGLFDADEYNTTTHLLETSKKQPKYLAIFISLVSVTYCLLYQLQTRHEKMSVFRFSLGCVQDPHEFLDYITTSISDILSKNFHEQVKDKDIAVFVSAQQYEGTTNRVKIQRNGDSLFAKFIIESDAITNYRAFLSDKNGICVTINDGNGITYSLDKGKHITKEQGYGFPISDIAGNMWIGCEAIKHVINVKEGLETSSLLSDKILAMFNDDIYALSEIVMLKPFEAYTKASSAVRELISGNEEARNIVKRSADLLLKRIKLIDNKLNTNLPIVVTGDLANLYKNFFPKNRLIDTKEKPSDLLLTYGLKFLKKRCELHE